MKPLQFLVYSIPIYLLYQEQDLQIPLVHPPFLNTHPYWYIIGAILHRIKFIILNHSYIYSIPSMDHSV
jgi:hypothetical protein